MWLATSHCTDWAIPTQKNSKNICLPLLECNVKTTSAVWHSDDRALWYVHIIKANEMHYFSNLFDKVLYMFRTGPLTVIRSISTLYTQQQVFVTQMTNTYCMYTVLRYSWWCTADLSETCGVLYQINLRNSASCWHLLYDCKCCSHWDMCLAVLLFCYSPQVLKFMNLKLCWGQNWFCASYK